MISEEEKEELKKAILKDPVFQRLLFCGYDVEIEIDEISDPELTKVSINLKTQTRH